MTWHRSFVAFDTETTGLGSSARVLEIGAVTFEDGEVVHEWSQLLWPEGVNWDDPNVQSALAVNQLTREVLVGKPSFEDILPDLMVELANPVLVAHNATFDLRMLGQELARVVLPAPTSLLDPDLLICTRNLSAHLSVPVSNKLKDAAAYYRVSQESAHRATVDAKVCGQVLLEMWKTGSLPEDNEKMLALCRQLDIRNVRRK